MPAGDSKIKFTVEGITQLHQSFQTILNDSKALTDEWARQGSSIVKSLQEQIELLKKRNSVAVPPSSGTPPTQPTGQGSSNFGDIEAALETMVSDGILLHRDSIKELAELLKQSTPTTPPPTQPTPGKPSSTATPEDDKKVNFGQLMGRWAFANMLRPIQSNDPIAAGLSMGGNLGSALMSTKNPYAVAAGGVLSLLTGIIGAQYQTISGIAPTAAQAARQMGGSWQGWTIPTGEGASYGLMRNEVLQRQIELSKAMGRTNVSSSLSSALLWESTTNLSAGDIASFARSARGDRSFDLGTALSAMVTTLKQSGVSQEKLQTQMSEYLREIASLNQQQLEQFGKADVGLNEAIFARVARALPQTAEANPALIGRIAGSLVSGMSTPASRQIEVLQYQAAARVAPNASWYQLRTMREDPFGLAEGLTEEERAQRRQYATSFVEGLKGATADRDQWAYMLEKQFGLSSNVAWRLSGQETLDMKELLKEATAARRSTAEKQAAEEQLRTKLPGTVDDISKMLASWEMVKVGSDISGIAKAVETIRDLMTAVTAASASATLSSDFGDMVDTHQRIADAVRKDAEGKSAWSRFWAWWVATTVEMAPYQK